MKKFIITYIVVPMYGAHGLRNGPRTDVVYETYQQTRRIFLAVTATASSAVSSSWDRNIAFAPSNLTLQTVAQPFYSQSDADVTEVFQSPSLIHLHVKRQWPRGFKVGIFSDNCDDPNAPGPGTQIGQKAGKVLQLLGLGPLR